MVRLFGPFVFLAMFSSLAIYPQQFGEISGTTTDATGAVMPGAVVTVANTATQQVRTATSNGSGVYSMPNILPGTYDFRVEKAGFKVTTRREVEVQVGDVIRLDFALQLGDVSQQ